MVCKFHFHRIPLKKIGRFVTEAKSEQREHFRVRRSLRTESIAQMRQNLQDIMKNMLDQYPVGG